MNINNRLKKIEVQIVPQNCFCGCWARYWKTALGTMYSQVSNPETTAYPLPDFEKGFCEKCQKPFLDKDVEMAGNLVKLYGDGE